MREALFSSLESSLGTLNGVSVLDVYAGSGAVGLEAASRGATRVTAVERERAVGALIASNARTLGLDQVEVVTAAAAALGARGTRPAFDVAFLDPPYDVPNETLSETVAALATNGWLARTATVVVERSRRAAPWAWPAGFEATRERRYGDTVLWYGRWESPRREVAGQSLSDEES